MRDHGNTGKKCLELSETISMLQTKTDKHICRLSYNQYGYTEKEKKRRMQMCLFHLSSQTSLPLCTPAFQIDSFLKVLSANTRGCFIKASREGTLDKKAGIDT